MAALAYEELDDLISSTLSSYPEPRWGMIAQDLTTYPLLEQMLKPPAMRKKTTQTMKHQLQVTQTKGAKHAGAYQDDSLNVQDNLQGIEVPWRHTTNNFTFDYMEEIFNNGDPESLGNQILDLIESREADCMLGLAEIMELAWLGKPSSSSDKLTPWGLQYWLKLATADQEGQLGGDITGFSSGPGGLSSDTYTNWKHYLADYDAFTDDDLSRKMRKAWRAIMFKSPVKALKGNGAEGYRYKIMCGEDAQEGMIDIARSQNDNIGRDLATYMDDITFKKIPIEYVPAIDSTWTSNEDPIFMLDLKHFQTCVHGKNAWRRTGPLTVDKKHTTRSVFYDVTWNIMCTDRRRQAVLNRAS